MLTPLGRKQTNHMWLWPLDCINFKRSLSLSKNWWTTQKKKSWRQYVEESYSICFSGFDLKNKWVDLIGEQFSIHQVGRDEKKKGNFIANLFLFFLRQTIWNDGSKSNCVLSNSFLCDPIKIEIIFKDLSWG